MLKILFATSEIHPLIKTGGLADVAASLPRALAKLGHDIRIILPAYPSVLRQAIEVGMKELTRCFLDDQEVILWQTRLPGTRMKVLLIDFPAFSDREGNPYCGADGHDWPDNARRFYDFSRITRLIALNKLSQDWQPDIVHCNDWQTGLVPALLAEDEPRPATVFTIHNLAYRGLFSRQTFDELRLPLHWWNSESLEFYDQLAFMKGGLVYADRITAVSPGYAREIQTATQGWGLEGLLYHRRDVLRGILNGIDCDEWNPGSDKYIAHNYNRRTLQNKQKNKLALQAQSGLTISEKIPLLGFIGRMVDQKGIDLILALLPKFLAEERGQCIILGSGMPNYETAFTALANQYPQSLSVCIGYNEALAHQIEAGADIFLMPSAFEPCGLNQLYSLRYGTVPIVHGVGGLADSVKNYSDQQSSDANGFVFFDYTQQAFELTLEHATQVYENKPEWQRLQLNGMNENLSWTKSAQEYVDLYQSIPKDL
jgi:starch synthase